MTDFLYSIDLSVFHFINDTIANPFFDKFFPYITEVKHWFLVYIIFFLALMIKGGRYGRIAALGAIVVITFSDQFNSGFIKDLFGRIRPCNALADVNIRSYCSGSFSFPSSHAVNNFAIAVFFMRLYPQYKVPLLITASLVALSRPYVGVHYPSDIIAGAVLGCAIGYLFSYLALKINEMIEKRVNNKAIS